MKDNDFYIMSKLLEYEELESFVIMMIRSMLS